MGVIEESSGRKCLILANSFKKGVIKMWRLVRMRKGIMFSFEILV